MTLLFSTSPCLWAGTPAVSMCARCRGGGCAASRAAGGAHHRGGRRAERRRPTLPLSSLPQLSN